MLTIYVACFYSEVIRKTRLASVDGQEGGEASYLGYEGRPFSFDDVVNEITWVSSSAENGDVADMESWIRSLYPIAR